MIQCSACQKTKNDRKTKKEKMQVSHCSGEFIDDNEHCLQSDESQQYSDISAQTANLQNDSSGEQGSTTKNIFPSRISPSSFYRGPKLVF